MALGGVEADALAGSEGEALALEASPAQIADGLFGNAPATSLGGQVEDLGHVAGPQGLDGGQESRDRLADAGGGLGEKVALALDGAEGGAHQILLAPAEVVKGELELLNGAIAFAAPGQVVLHPAQVPVEQGLEEAFEFRGLAGAALLLELA